MTKHQLVEAAPKLLARVVESEHRSVAEKVEFVDFLTASLSRAADNLDPLTDCDLFRPLADLFGLLGDTRELLQTQLEED